MGCKYTYLYYMRYPKKRKAKQIDNDKEGETALPARKTKEIAESHKTGDKSHVSKNRPDVLNQGGTREDGKELFDFVLKGLASPDTE
jgi:hypothetical protein